MLNGLLGKHTKRDTYKEGYYRTAEPFLTYKGIWLGPKLSGFSIYLKHDLVTCLDRRVRNIEKDF